MSATHIRKLPSALEEFDHIQELLAGKQVAVFLDYDGTLTPIVAHPEDALLSASMRKILIQLAARYAIAIISGRDLEDVKKRVGIEEIYYAGSHGFDISGPGGIKSELAEAKEALPLLKQAEKKLQEAIKNFEGAQIELKKFSLAVHYRNVDVQKKADFKSQIEKLCTSFKGLKLIYGKEVFDLQPNLDWHKGKALLWLKERMALHGPVFSFYIGDDVTDEDAFKVVREEGIGIIVESEGKKTYASYMLRNTDEVEGFLGRL